MGPSNSPGAGSVRVWWTTRGSARIVRRAVFSFIAAALADLIVGFGVFSVAVLSIVWYFSFSWIGLAHGYAAIGQGFGTAAQLWDATLLLGVSPAIMGIVAFLSVRAFRLPRALWDLGRRHPAPKPVRTRAAVRPSPYDRSDWHPSGSESQGLGSAMFALASSRRMP